MSDFENISELEPELDGQIYKPAPQIVPDTRTGFSENGDYHCPDVAGRDLAYTHQTMPYMIAVNLQAEVARYCSTSDYTVGEDERHMIAIDLVNEWSEQNAFDPIDLAYEGLNHWRRMYLRRE